MVKTLQPKYQNFILMRQSHVTNLYRNIIYFLCQNLGLLTLKHNSFESK